MNSLDGVAIASAAIADRLCALRASGRSGNSCLRRISD